MPVTPGRFQVRARVRDARPTRRTDRTAGGTDFVVGEGDMDSWQEQEFVAGQQCV
jgi:hypothetical protein